MCYNNKAAKGGERLLQVGDQVVYPMHGAGVIADIEQCEVMGEVKSYYVLKMPIGSMKVMIPTDNVENIGLRDVISKKGVKKVAEVLADGQNVAFERVGINDRFGQSGKPPILFEEYGLTDKAILAACERVMARK